MFTRRDEIWGHSQYVQNKVSKRKITRKAGGEEVVEEVEEPEEEEEYVLLFIKVSNFRDWKIPSFVNVLIYRSVCVLWWHISAIKLPLKDFCPLKHYD